MATSDRAFHLAESGISRRDFLKRSLGGAAIMLAAAAVPEVAIAAEAYKPTPRLLGILLLAVGAALSLRK